jgi:hypothetical protein
VVNRFGDAPSLVEFVGKVVPGAHVGASFNKPPKLATILLEEIGAEIGCTDCHDRLEFFDKFTGRPAGRYGKKNAGIQAGGIEAYSAESVAHCDHRIATVNRGIQQSVGNHPAVLTGAACARNGIGSALKHIQERFALFGMTWWWLREWRGGIFPPVTATSDK